MENFQEKIFAHTDKSFYVCGEIIWFKLYNVDAYSNKPVEVSKIGYVEVLTDDKKPVLQAKIELSQGTGRGSFMIPFSLNSGVYILRAYTNWMKNYGADYFFEKKMSIINLQKEQPESIISTKSAYEITFFPEGGNLVNGIKTKVGFKTINQFGKFKANVIIQSHINTKNTTSHHYHILKER